MRWRCLGDVEDFSSISMGIFVQVFYVVEFVCPITNRLKEGVVM